MSNSRLAEVEAAFAAQKSEVGWKPVAFDVTEPSANTVGPRLPVRGCWDYEVDTPEQDAAALLFLIDSELLAVLAHRKNDLYC